jgi:hypothetical protein
MRSRSFTWISSVLSLTSIIYSVECLVIQRPAGWYGKAAIWKGSKDAERLRAVYQCRSIWPSIPSVPLLVAVSQHITLLLYLDSMSSMIQRATSTARFPLFHFARFSRPSTSHLHPHRHHRVRSAQFQPRAHAPFPWHRQLCSIPSDVFS